MLTQKRLKELLHYDESTGVFTWRVAKSHRMRVGSVAGSVALPKGYIRIKIDCRNYLAHRLALFYVHGVFPASETDHINRIKTDNRIANLRPCTQSENNKNTHVNAKNTSGFKGVSRYRGKWTARGAINGTRHYLGYFPTAEAASEAYEAFARQNHGAFYLPQKVAR